MEEIGAEWLELRDHRRLTTTINEEMVKKIDEIVRWANGVDRQLTELYQQQEELLKKNKMGYWHEHEKKGDPAPK